MLCICVFFKKDAKTFETLETLKTNIHNFFDKLFGCLIYFL